MNRLERALCKSAPWLMKEYYLAFYYGDMMRAIGWLDGRGAFTIREAIQGIAGAYEWSSRYAEEVLEMMAYMGWIAPEPETEDNLKPTIC